MGKIVTFGKFKGHDTDTLAKAGDVGRGYLSWGADKLRSPIWRDEFARALAENEQDDAIAVQYLVEFEGLHWDDAERFINDQKAEMAEAEEGIAAYHKEMSKFYAHWGVELGVDAQAAAKVGKQISLWSPEELPRNKFSTEAKWRTAQEMLRDGIERGILFHVEY